MTTRAAAVSAMGTILLWLPLIASCGDAEPPEVLALRTELTSLMAEERAREDAGETSLPESWRREDRISLIRARLRFYEAMGRLPQQEDSLEEFDAKLVMRTLERLVSGSIRRIDEFRSDHGRYPASLAEAGLDLADQQVDLGFHPLYGDRTPSVKYWSGPEHKDYVFGVRMHCGAWFGLAPNTWTLDFLTSSTDLTTHPEYDGFEKYDSEGRWAVWYDG